MFKSLLSPPAPECHLYSVIPLSQTAKPEEETPITFSFRYLGTTCLNRLEDFSEFLSVPWKNINRSKLIRLFLAWPIRCTSVEIRRHSTLYMGLWKYCGVYFMYYFLIKNFYLNRIFIIFILIYQKLILNSNFYLRILHLFPLKETCTSK